MNAILVTGATGNVGRSLVTRLVEAGVEVLDWVSLRPTVFASNFIGMWSPQLRAGDVVSGPYAAASMAPVVDGGSTLDKPAMVTHEVDKILGRPAESFAHWVADRRDLFTE